VNQKVHLDEVLLTVEFAAASLTASAKVVQIFIVSLVRSDNSTIFYFYNRLMVQEVTYAVMKGNIRHSKAHTAIAVYTMWTVMIKF